MTQRFSGRRHSGLALGSHLSLSLRLSHSLVSAQHSVLLRSFPRFAVGPLIEMVRTTPPEAYRPRVPD